MDGELVQRKKLCRDSDDIRLLFFLLLFFFFFSTGSLAAWTARKCIREAMSFLVMEVLCRPFTAGSIAGDEAEVSSPAKPHGPNQA